MKTINRLYFLGLISILLACGSDDDPDPIEPADPPMASFTFTADELEVTFTNSSSNATTYSWDFGDGNSSTEVSPVHTYEVGGTYEVKLTASNDDLNDETTVAVTVGLNPENVRLTSGFVITGISDDGSTSFVQYFEELPSGTIDLSQGQAFQSFSATDVFDGAMYTSRTDGSNGFAKMMVNGNEEIIEEAVIATTGGASLMRVRDSNTGIFIDTNTPTQIKVFDPEVMLETGNVDLSGAQIFAQGARTSSAVFRGDDIFIALREAIGTAPLENYTMIMGNIASGALVNELVSTTGLTRGFNPISRISDEQGNLYIHHQGDLSPFGNQGGVLKIPAGSNDFDPDYDFRLIFDPTLFLQVTRSFAYYQDGIAYAQIAFETPQAVIDIVEDIGGLENLTPQLINELSFILASEENAGWVELDLNAQQVVGKVEGLPAIPTFAASTINFIDNLPHFVINNSTVNALYRHDPMTGQTEEVFSATGATLSSVINLSSNNFR